MSESEDNEGRSTSLKSNTELAMERLNPGFSEKKPNPPEFFWFDGFFLFVFSGFY